MATGKRRGAWRGLIATLCAVPALAWACKPAGQAPAVEALWQTSAYVLLADVLAVRHRGDTDEADIRIVEQFKGTPIAAIVSPAHTCGLQLEAGQTRLFFLDADRSGSVVRYPHATPYPEILTRLRAMRP